MNRHPNMVIIVDILGTLGFQIFQGWQALQVAKYLLAAYEQGRIKKAWLFPTIYYASLESAFSALSRIILSSETSANWESLLSYAQRFATAFPDAEEHQVLQRVTQYRMEAAQLEPLLATIRLHHDKGVVPYGQGIAVPLIDFADMEELFTFFLRMTNTFLDYATASELILDSVEKGIAAEIDHLLTLLEQAN